MWQSIGLTLLVIVATLACVLLFMLCAPAEKLWNLKKLQDVKSIPGGNGRVGSRFVLSSGYRRGNIVVLWLSTGIPFLLMVKTLVCVMVIIHLLLAVAVPFRMWWYVVWQLFLSKFKFLRELIGDTGSQQGDNEPSEAEAEQETPPSPQRSRQKSARQRRAPAEDST